MPLVPFSSRYPDEFLSRTEDNFPVLLEKLAAFYKQTRDDIGDGTVSRRKPDGRFNYEEELHELGISQKGISSKEIAAEFNEMIRGCMRHNDLTTAFNLNPSPLFDIVAGITLLSLYTPNSCWDFASGKLGLFEKKIVRILGQLVNWHLADGLVVTGGKQALLYAIKCGMGRARVNLPVAMSDFVVISSKLAHFSIKHVCHYLGISPENYLTIATITSGEMDLQSFEETLNYVISQNKKIAAVIAVGGATINLIPDPILSLKQVIDRVVKNHRLNYTPYLHVDSVISWIWLTFEKDVSSSWENQCSPKIAAKINSVLSKLEGIQYADSFAADFHKTGFCPYGAGVFITRERNNLSGMILDEKLPQQNMQFGEQEIYQLTLENSRSGTSIASIWIALRRLGLEGLRQFVLYQLEVCELFKQKIHMFYSDHFEVLNEHSNGWEIVFKPHFRNKISWDQLQSASLEEQNLYNNACHLFASAFWYGSLNDEHHRTPVIGFIKSYTRKGNQEQGLPAFLIHPSSLHYDEEGIDEMLKGIVCAKIAFESHHLAVTSESSVDYLYDCVPPR